MRGCGARRTRLSPDTIVALATPPGEGGVAVIRLSGPRAPDVLEALFRGPRLAQSHRLYLGHLVHPDDGQTIDQVLAVLMRAPRSYTGEEVAEVHSHGGSAVADAIVSACLTAGARLARPGEFTLRAFLNGRLDLAQAEAVGQIIAARSGVAARLAARNLEGRLSRSVEQVRVGLLDWLSRLEAEIDFGPEVPEFPREESRRRLDWALGQVEGLLAGARVAKMAGQGLRMVLAGPPNAGKSTLLNALLGHERALVTDIPGTTRDTLEETVVLRGSLVCLVDTAGLRDTCDRVEQLGIERTRLALEQADLVVLVLDRSQRELGPQFRTLNPNLILLNKSDLGAELPVSELAEAFPAVPWLEVCLLESADREAVFDRLGELARALSGDHQETFNLTQRQTEVLERCRRSLKLVGSTLEQGLSAEYVCLDLREATSALGEIIGLEVGEEILDRIFSAFCLGK